jgi:hypothetical protein
MLTREPRDGVVGRNERDSRSEKSKGSRLHGKLEYESPREISRCTRVQGSRRCEIMAQQVAL